MRYTVEDNALVDNNYITLNVGDIIISLAIWAPPKFIVLRIDKTGRDF